MSMVASAAANGGRGPQSLTDRGLVCAMQLAFAPVFNWRDPEAHGAEAERIVGLDGSTLSLAVLRARTLAQPKGVVVLCHPFLKYGKSYFLRAGYPEWFSSAGYHVVAFDFKGFGASRPQGIRFADDVASVACWAQQHFPGELPLHLLGASFGAFHGLHALALHPHGFASAVFDSMPARIDRFFSSGFTGVAMRRLGSSRWAARTGTQPVFEAAHSARHVPLLFMYGELDPFVTEQEQAHLRSLCPDAQVNVHPGCGHLGLMKSCHDAYLGDITRFFDRHSEPRRQAAEAG